MKCEGLKIGEKRLFVVSTYYHALISCVKQMLDSRESDIVITSYIPDSSELAERIQQSGLFENTFLIGDITEYSAKNKIDYILNFHRKNADKIRRQLDVSFEEYDEINVFHEDIWPSHYLKDCKIPFRLLEDSLDFYKHISKSNFAYMLPINKLKSAVKRRMNIGYVFCGTDSCVREIEVNSIEDTEIAVFAGDKLTEAPRAAMFHNLSDSNWDTLIKIFAGDIPPIEPSNSVIILTQPLFSDNLAGSEKEQIEIYRNVAAENLSGNETLVIKPHPRDTVDYLSAFSDAIVIDRHIPTEVFSHIVSGEFAKAVTLFSSSLDWINAKNKIYYGGTK